MKPIIGISLGDPAGISPEIIVKTMLDQTAQNAARMVLVGDAGVVRKALAATGLQADIHSIEQVEDAVFKADTIELIDLKNMPQDYAYGQVSAACGKAAFQYIDVVARLAMDGKVDAIATGPINKESLRAGDIPYIGHTEILADISGVQDPLTMFEVNGMRVFFLSRHLSLRQACDAVTYERMLDYLQRCTEAMQRLGVEGTIAVAGLNPHCGEHGLFGTEEMDHVVPAIEEARRRGLNVTGPIGADSVFHLAKIGRFAAVLSLYHDQGHIATKTLDFEKTISITNSMPFLRTSVDHGTAFDIAGKNLASAVSMIESVLLAAKYAHMFRRS